MRINRNNAIMETRQGQGQREKDEGTAAICPEAAVDDNKGRKREPHHCNQHQKGKLHRHCTMT